MKKFKLQLDTDRINLENEIHSNNFHFKVKNLAEHCIKFLIGEHNSNDCNDMKYHKEIHDQDIIPIIEDNNDEDILNKHKLIAQIFKFNEHS